LRHVVRLRPSGHLRAHPSFSAILHAVARKQSNAIPCTSQRFELTAISTVPTMHATSKKLVICGLMMASVVSLEANIVWLPRCQL
jgi:hypothetical protein